MEKHINQTAIIKAVRSFYFSGWIYRNAIGLKGTDYKVVGTNFDGEISYHTINPSTESVMWGHYGFKDILEAVDTLKKAGSYEPIGAFDAKGNVVWLISSL